MLLPRLPLLPDQAARDRRCHGSHNCTTLLERSTNDDARAFYPCPIVTAARAAPRSSLRSISFLACYSAMCPRKTDANIIQVLEGQIHPKSIFAPRTYLHLFCFVCFSPAKRFYCVSSPVPSVRSVRDLLYPHKCVRANARACV